MNFIKAKSRGACFRASFLGQGRQVGGRYDIIKPLGSDSFTKHDTSPDRDR